MNPTTPDDFDNKDDMKVFEAAREGRLEDLDRLLREGFWPKSRKIDGQSPLMAAAWGGHADCVARLLDVCNPSDFNLRGDDAMDAAIHGGQANCVRILAPASAQDPKRRARRLWAAIARGGVWGAQCLDALSPTREDAAARDGQGKTALMKAASQGKPEFIGPLLLLSDAMERTSAGLTALDFACKAAQDSELDLRKNALACVDLLAESASIDHLRDVVLAVGRDAAPRAAAMVEAWELKTAAGQGESAIRGSEAPSGETPPEGRGQKPTLRI